MSELKTDLNDRIESDHQALHGTMKELEKTFSVVPKPAEFANWKLDLLWQLRDFNNQLQKHFDLEESTDYNIEISRVAPHLLRRIEHLEEDHLKIISDLSHILGVLKRIDHIESGNIERVKARVDGLISFLRKHEAAEREVMQEAYYQDYGGGD